jgi:hypothetical protein
LVDLSCPTLLDHALRDRGISGVVLKLAVFIDKLRRLVSRINSPFVETRHFFELLLVVFVFVSRGLGLDLILKIGRAVDSFDGLIYGSSVANPQLYVI